MDQIIGLAVAHTKPGEHADHLGVPLGAEDGVGGVEARRVEAGKGGAVTFPHGLGQVRTDVPARVLQQRHQVIGRRPGDRVLEIEQAAGGDTLARRQPHQVVHVVVPEHQGPGLGVDHGKGGQPRLDIAAAHRLRGRAVEHGGHVPVGEPACLLQQRGVVIGRKALRNRLGRAVQMDEHVHGEGVKGGLVPAAGQHARVGVVAQVLQQQQAGVGVLGQDFRRAQPQVPEVPGHADERAHVFVRRRRVHEHRPPGAVDQTLVAAERGVAGKGPALRPVPPVDGEEGGDALVALRQGRPPAAFFARRRNR